MVFGSADEMQGSVDMLRAALSKEECGNLALS
jgi:hypothetical protein